MDHGKTLGTTAVALTKKQLKPHSAAHTLAFIEREYVEVDDDAEHFTWSDIMYDSHKAPQNDDICLGGFVHDIKITIR
jgi:hypothetical protein